MLECGLRAVVLHNKEVVWNYYAEFTADCRRINTNQKKRLLIAPTSINTSTTLEQLANDNLAGYIYVVNRTLTVPSYGVGIIVYASNSAFKALFTDDDTHSLYLWSCHKQQASSKVVDVISTVKIA